MRGTPVESKLDPALIRGQKKDVTFEFSHVTCDRKNPIDQLVTPKKFNLVRTKNF